MNFCMTTTAKRDQVFQGVVAQLFGRGHTCTINMMDMQIFCGSAVLAGEVVTFQGFLPVTAKVVVVKCFAPIFLPLGILRQSLASLQRSAFLQADRAVFLWSRCVREVSAALNALQRATNCHRPLLLAKAPQVKHVLLLPVAGSALWATLLHRARGLVKHLAYKALTLLESVTGLTVGGQCARFASLQVGRCLGHLRSTVETGQDPVLAPLHSANPILSVL